MLRLDLLQLCTLLSLIVLLQLLDIPITMLSVKLHLFSTGTLQIVRSILMVAVFVLQLDLIIYFATLCCALVLSGDLGEACSPRALLTALQVIIRIFLLQKLELNEPARN